MSRPREFWLAGEPNEAAGGVWYDHHPGVHMVSGKEFHRYHVIEYRTYDDLMIEYKREIELHGKALERARMLETENVALKDIANNANRNFNGAKAELEKKEFQIGHYALTIDVLKAELAHMTEKFERNSIAAGDYSLQLEKEQENHHFYKREWESCCERYDYAREELAQAKAGTAFWKDRDLSRDGLAQDRAAANQRVKAAETERDQLKLEVENLSIKLQRTVSAAYHALLEMTAWMGIPEKKREVQIHELMENVKFCAEHDCRHLDESQEIRSLKLMAESYRTKLLKHGIDPDA